MSLREDIEDAINRNSAENGSDTPDFVLAGYLMDCLAAFDKAVRSREAYYGRGAAALGFEMPSPTLPVGDRCGHGNECRNGRHVGKCSYDGT